MHASKRQAKRDMFLGDDQYSFDTRRRFNKRLAKSNHRRGLRRSQLPLRLDGGGVPVQ